MLRQDLLAVLNQFWFFRVVRADFLEGLETGCSGCVGVDVDAVGTFYVLKDAHGGVADVVFHHLGVGDAVFDVVGGVLEYASGAVLALVRT